jgi:hypothetical protein
MPAKNGFQLNGGDLELLNYVFQLRIAHIGHLAALSGRSEIALWRRLRKLRERRYLASVGRFMQKHIYAIGSEAKPVLIEHGYAEQDLREKRLRHNELAEIGIRHSLFVADIHMHLLILTRTGPVKIEVWREGQTLFDSVVVSKGEPALPVRPDAYFVLHHTGQPEGKNRLHFFLEADRSTMNHTRMATKISAYLAYYEQGRHARKYPGIPTFVVATVTQTPSRADELRRDLHPLIPHAAWRDAYLFIPFADLTLASLLPRARGSAWS